MSYVSYLCWGISGRHFFATCPLLGFSLLLFLSLNLFEIVWCVVYVLFLFFVVCVFLVEIFCDFVVKFLLLLFVEASCCLTIFNYCEFFAGVKFKCILGGVLNTRYCLGDIDVLYVV